MDRKCKARTLIKMNNDTILDTADNTLATSHSVLDLLARFSSLGSARAANLFFFFNDRSNLPQELLPAGLQLTLAQDDAPVFWGSLVSLL